MGKVAKVIDAKLRKWIVDQPLFFVGTAPLAGDGRVNVSPKGPIGSLRVVDASTVAYLDVVGSGAETIAHVRENGRIVVMFCAFKGPPRIVRLHGRGEIVLARDNAFARWIKRCAFEDVGIPEARRGVIVVRVERVADSCGYGVPLMKYAGERTQMKAWGAKKLRQDGAAVFAEYQRRKNATSIDGLPAIDIDE